MKVVLVGAEKLALHEGPWELAWTRYCEAPKRYPYISSHLKKCKMVGFNLFSDVVSHGSWPQWNESQENELRRELLKLTEFPPHKAREILISCESKHGARRELVWSELGESCLANTLKYLFVLAETTSISLAAGNAKDMQASYRHTGWPMMQC